VWTLINTYTVLIDLDTVMTVDNNNEFWFSLMTLAKKMRFGLELFLACRYTQKILQTEIPDFVQSEISQFSPWNIAFLDFIYEKTLKPNHPICTPTFFAIAENAVFIRGHFQKMPPHFLIYHLLYKGCISLLQGIFGKHVFTKELDSP
jgi:hypothetical protein